MCQAPDQWYGSDSKIDLWHDEVLRQLQRKQAKVGSAMLRR
jgi:hypothetical protein